MKYSDHHVLIIGSQGFIGSHFGRALPQAMRLDRHQLDLCDVSFKIPDGNYRIALICAGMGNPRACEQNPDLSYRCNVEGTVRLGQQLKEAGIFPVFFSSDYVLDDSHQVVPLNVYGKQKKELEQCALKIGGLIIRLSKVYGLEKGDGTLFDEMAQKMVRKEKIQAAYDQIFSPICIQDLIRFLPEALNEGMQGIITLSGPTFASRFEMALYLEKLLKLQGMVEKISLDDLKDGVKRPKQLGITGTFSIRSWQEGVEEVAKNYS